MTVPSETSGTIDPREVSLYAGHFDALWGVAWSPDGTRLLSGSHDGTARVWDANRGTELFALAGPSLSISAVAWSPDGTRLLTAAEDHSVRIWDATTGADLLTLGVGGSGVGGAVAWSPDSTRILTSFDDASARIWDASSGQVVRTLSGHTEHLTAVSWSPDGTRVATASDDGTARVWDVTTGTELLRVGPMAFVGRGATVGPDGRPTHVGPIEPMTGLSWSPDSRRIITAFDSAEPRVWDAATGEEVLSLHGRERRWVSVVSWSPDGSRIITDDISGTTAHIWDAATGEELLSLRGHSQWACALAWSPDSRRVATGSHDDTVRVWDAATGQTLLVLGPGNSVETVSWSPDGTKLTIGAKNGGNRVWDATTGEPRLTVDNGARELSEVVWSPDGTRLATSSYLSPRVLILDASTGDVVQALTAGEDDVNDISWSPDSERILTGLGDDRAAIWDAARGERVLTLEGHSDMITSVAWSPNGQRALTGSQDGTARIWDAATGEVIHTYTGNWVRDVVWTQGGPRVVTGSADGAAHVWDVITSGELVTLRDEGAMVRSYAWSPDGTRVLAGFDDGVVRVWDEVSGKIVLSLAGHRFGVTDAQWSPDGTRILTGSEDGTARLWDAATGEMTGLFLCFLPDGGVAVLDAPSLSLRSGPGEVWDYLGRPEILAGQLTRVGVERRQYIDPNPVRDVAAQPAQDVLVDGSAAAEEPSEPPRAPEVAEAAEAAGPAEPVEVTEPAEPAGASEQVSPESPEWQEVPAPSGASAPSAPAASADSAVGTGPAQTTADSAQPAAAVEENVPAEAQGAPVATPESSQGVPDETEDESAADTIAESVTKMTETEEYAAEVEIVTPVSAPETGESAAARQARHAAATAGTPAETASTSGQPVTPAPENGAVPTETEPVAAPTGETLLVQPFPVDQSLVDGEVTAPAVSTPSTAEGAAAPVAAPAAEERPAQEPEDVQQKQTEEASAHTPAADERPAQEPESVIETPAVPGDRTNSANAPRARHVADTSQTPADPGAGAVVERTGEAATEATPEGGVDAASALASPPRTVQSSGAAESAYEPVVVPAVEHTGGEPVAAPTGETVAHPEGPEPARADAPEQQPMAASGEAWEHVAVSARTPVDATGHDGQQADTTPSGEPTEPAKVEIPWYAASVEGAVPPATDEQDTAETVHMADPLSAEAQGASASEPVSAPTNSTPEDSPEDSAAQGASAEQPAVEHSDPVVDSEPTEQPGEAVDDSAERDSEEAPDEEPAPAPWGDEELRRRIYTEVQEFVAAIARRDVNELASRYGIAGHDLAGLDEQLAGLSFPASDLALYPVEQADDYIDGHHRLGLSELEGGGVVIASELWAHGAATGARLVAHWNPMGIYPFDFRHVSM